MTTHSPAGDRWWRSKKANETRAACARLVARLREAERLDSELNWAESRPGDGRVVIIPGGPGWRGKVILESRTEPSSGPHEEPPALAPGAGADREAEAGQ